MRVVVCYTGGVGSQVLRLLAKDPAHEIVGVLVHGADKEGRDVGDIVGIAPLGVSATRDVQSLVDLRPDCVLWHGLNWDPDEVAQFLSSGANVYNGMSGFFLPGTPDEKQLVAACEEGQSSFAAGGNIPGLISDVLPLFLSGYVGDIRTIRAWQRNHVPTYPSAEQLELGLGFGVPVDQIPTPSPVDAIWTTCIGEAAQLVASGLGVEYGGMEISKKEYGLAPQDTVLEPSGLRIAAGTPAGVRWTFSATTAGGYPFLQVVNEQTSLLGLGDDWRQSVDDPNWRVEIDGTPSLVSTVRVTRDEGGIDPVCALNAARAVNFIGPLVAAPPGWRSVLDLPAPRAHLVAEQVA